MKKLLIVTHSFPPSNAPAAQRTFFFGKYLKETSGIDVEIIAPGTTVTASGVSNWAEKHDSPAVLHQTRYMPMANRIFKSVQNQRNTRNERSSTRVGIIPRVKQAVFNNFLVPDRGIVWYRFALRQASKLVKADSSIRCVFTSSPSFSDHLVAAKLKQKFGIPWIADLRDFHWIEAREHTTQGRIRDRQQRFETKVLKEADGLTFISESMRDEYIARYPFIEPKAFEIYNGFDPIEFPSPEPNRETPLVLFYSGSFYGGERNPRPLFSALDSLLVKGQIGLEDIRIDIAGPIDVQSRSIVDEYKSSQSVNYLGVIPRPKVLQLMSRSDLLWLIVGNLKSHYHSFPVKGYEYIAAQKPILAFCPFGSESQNILRESGYNDIFDTDVDLESLCDFLMSRITDKQAGRIHQRKEHSCIVRFTRKHQSTQLGLVVSKLLTAQAND